VGHFPFLFPIPACVSWKKKREKKKKESKKIEKKERGQSYQETIPICTVGSPSVTRTERCCLCLLVVAGFPCFVYLFGKKNRKELKTNEKKSKKTKAKKRNGGVSIVPRANFCSWFLSGLRHTPCPLPPNLFSRFDSIALLRFCTRFQQHLIVFSTIIQLRIIV
jgi:hypothetical protein